MLEEKIKRANILLEALPYIKKFKGSAIVIKYGGSLMSENDLQLKISEDIVLLKYIGLLPIIVHGGGKDISYWSKKLDKDPIFVNGLRYTDHETIQICEMVLSGKINKAIVTSINAQGGKAVGLCGKDGTLFSAKTIDYERLGYVGHIHKIDSSLISSLLSNDYIPVISSIGYDESNYETLNLNADHVAGVIAASISALKLIYLTDVDGLKVEGKLKSNLSLTQACNLLEHSDVQGGMKPKLSYACEAIKSGVQHVHIINGLTEHVVLLEIFTNDGIGTMISEKESR